MSANEGFVTNKIFHALLLILLPLMTFGNACLQYYQPPKYNGKQNYSLQIYKMDLKSLESQLNKIIELPDEEKIAHLLSSDTRTILFRLQSLSRLHADIYDVPLFEKKRNFFKKFEDLIGNVDLKNSLVATSKKLEQPRLVKYFENLRLVAAQNLLVELHRFGLSSNPAAKLSSLYQELVEFNDWKKPRKDLKLQIKRVAKDAKILEQAVRAREFTKDDIEQGLHELRRQLRWLLIHVQSLNGLTTSDKNTNLPEEIKSYYEQMTAQSPNLLQNSFLKMRTPDIADPFIVPYIPRAMITELVTDIGVQKDKAEGDIYVNDAMTAIGFSIAHKIQVNYDLFKLTGRTEKIDHKELAEKYQQDLERSGLLKYFGNRLMKLNDID